MSGISSVADGDHPVASVFNGNWKHGIQWSRTSAVGSATLANPEVTFTPSSVTSIVVIEGFVGIDNASQVGITLALVDSVAGNLAYGGERADTTSQRFSASVLWVGTATVASHTVTLQVGYTTSAGASSSQDVRLASLVVKEYLA